MKSNLVILLVANGCKPLFSPRVQNKEGKYLLGVLKDTDFTVLAQSTETDPKTGKLKFKAITETEISTVKNAKILCFCDMQNVKSNDKMNVSIDFEQFNRLKVGQIINVTVDDRGYNTIDYKPLSSEQVASLIAEEVDA